MIYSTFKIDKSAIKLNICFAAGLSRLDSFDWFKDHFISKIVFFFAGYKFVSYIYIFP